MGGKGKFFTEARIVLLIRWWVAGAIYFYIGWGTGLGSKTNSIDFIFFLGLAIGLVNSFVLNPVLNKMFKLKLSKKYRDTSIMYKVKSRLIEIVKAMTIVVIMVQVYSFINITFIKIFDLRPESIPLPGEPITFGIIYVILYTIFEKIILKIENKSRKK